MSADRHPIREKYAAETTDGSLDCPANVLK